MSFNFDPQTFLNQTQSGTGDTKFRAVPIGDYDAECTKVEAKSINTKDGPRAIMELTWSTEDQAAKAATGMERPSARQGIFLDLTPAGTLDMGPGKNISLNRTREEFGLHVEGQPWHPNDFLGKIGRITVDHRVSQDDGEVYAFVKKVTKK